MAKVTNCRETGEGARQLSEDVRRLKKPRNQHSRTKQQKKKIIKHVPKRNCHKEKESTIFKLTIRGKITSQTSH